MTDFHVGDTTRRHPQTVTRVAEMLAEAAPLVEKITGLTLPAVVTCELHTPESAATESADYLRRALRRDTAGLTLTTFQHRMVAQMPETHRTKVTSVYARQPVDVVSDDSRFVPRLLVIPDALPSPGPDGAAWYAHLVSVLVTAVQTAASKGAVAPAKTWPISATVRFGGADFVKEGHDRWAGEVCSLLGIPPAKHHWRTGHTMSKRRSRAAEKFLRKAVEDAGVETVNRMWTDPALLPTRLERFTPRRWIRRISG